MLLDLFQVLLFGAILVALCVGLRRDCEDLSNTRRSEVARVAGEARALRASRAPVDVGSVGLQADGVGSVGVEADGVEAVGVEAVDVGSGYVTTSENDEPPTYAEAVGRLRES